MPEGMSPEHGIPQEFKRPPSVTQEESGSDIVQMYELAKTNEVIREQLIQKTKGKGNKALIKLILADPNQMALYMFIGILSPEDQITLSRKVLEMDTHDTRRNFLITHLQELTGPIPSDIGLELAKSNPVEVANNLKKFEPFKTDDILINIRNHGLRYNQPRRQISNEVVENLLEWTTRYIYIDFDTKKWLFGVMPEQILRNHKKKLGSLSDSSLYSMGRVLNKHDKNANDDTIEFWLDKMTPEDMSETKFAEDFVSSNIIERHPERFEKFLLKKRIEQDHVDFQKRSSKQFENFIKANPKLADAARSYCVGTEFLSRGSFYGKIRSDIEDAIKHIDNPDFILDMTPESEQDEGFHRTLNIGLLICFLDKKDPRYDQSLLRHAGRFTEPGFREKLEPVAQKQWEKTHDLSLLEHFPELIPVLSKKDVEKAATNGYIRLLFKNWDKAKDAGYSKEQVVDGAMKHRRYSEVAQALGALDTISPELYKTLWIELNKPENRVEAKSDPRLALALHLEKGTGYGNEVAEGLLDIGKRGQLAENLNRFSGLSQSVADRLSKRDEKTGMSFEEDVARYYSSFV